MSDKKQKQPDVAIALHYDGENAPRIAAKGRAELAERILALAEEHGIPLHEDPELVAVLAQIPLGDEIPETLYLVIAEVIAFAYMLTGKRPPGFMEGR